jgi:hypothetical protein
MSQTFIKLFTILVLLASCVYAAHIELEDEAPVPEGFSLPNIENAVTDRADGRHQAKILINMVAKEPKAARGVGFEKEEVLEDTWNGEADPEGMATVAQKKMLKEIASLENLIAQGKKILFVLPKKEKRLALLKSKLSVILDARAKSEAAEKLDQQEALLAAIKKREEAMSTRLSALKSSQSKLEKNVGKLKKVIAPKKKAAAKKARFQQTESEADAEGEADADAETEDSE